MKIEELLRESFNEYIVRLLLVDDKYYVGQSYNLRRSFYRHYFMSNFIDFLKDMGQDDIISKAGVIYNLDPNPRKSSFGYLHILNQIRNNIPTL